MVCSPRLVVLDEAASALDLSVQAQVLSLLAELQGEYGLSYLFVGHNLDVVRYISHRMVVLNRGQLVEEGPASIVSRTPREDCTKRLVLATLNPDPRVQSKRREARQLDRRSA